MYYLKNIVLAEDDFYRLCQEKKETTQHILYNYIFSAKEKVVLSPTYIKDDNLIKVRGLYKNLDLNCDLWKQVFDKILVDLYRLHVHKERRIKKFKRDVFMKRHMS